jgi:hypothetical protein
VKKILLNWGSKGGVGPFLALNDSDPQNETAGQSHIWVPRAGIEPTTKRISISCRHGVPMAIESGLFAGILAFSGAFEMSAMAEVFG